MWILLVVREDRNPRILDCEDVLPFSSTYGFSTEGGLVGGFSLVLRGRALVGMDGRRCERCGGGGERGGGR